MKKGRIWASVGYPESLPIDNEKFNMWDVARNHTILLNSYITSKRHKLKDDELGEITR